MLKKKISFGWSGTGHSIVIILCHWIQPGKHHPDSGHSVRTAGRSETIESKKMVERQTALVQDYIPNWFTQLKLTVFVIKFNCPFL
jgi:hypothetical protein